MRQGDKACKKTLFQWKPEWVSAALHYEAAGAFRAFARLLVCISMACFRELHAEHMRHTPSLNDAPRAAKHYKNAPKAKAKHVEVRCRPLPLAPPCACVRTLGARRLPAVATHSS